VPDQYDVNGLVPPARYRTRQDVGGRSGIPARRPAPGTIESLPVDRGRSCDRSAGRFCIQAAGVTQYTIATKGACDNPARSFEEIRGQPRYLAADDDSGEDRNASITYKLFMGRTYHISFVCITRAQTGTTSVMVS